MKSLHSRPAAAGRAMSAVRHLQNQILERLPGLFQSRPSFAVSLIFAFAIGFAYFWAARLGLALLTKPDGVAVFWPAAGLSAGTLIALGPSARWPVIAGAMAATIVANLVGDRTIWSALFFAVCNAGEAVIVAGLVERYFGRAFSLGRLRHVLGLFAAAIVASAISGVGGAIGFLFHSSTAPALTTWQHWFTADALGVVTVAPLLIGLASSLNDPPSRREFIEGIAALAILVVLFLSRFMRQSLKLAALARGGNALPSERQHSPSLSHETPCRVNGNTVHL
jgi:integral membrane sensor domain MASE1